MLPVIPASITAIVVAAQVAIAAAIWIVLYSGVGRCGLPAPAQRRVRIASAVFLGGWLAAALTLALSPSSVVTRDPFSITPLIPILFVLSVVTAIVALWRSSSLRRVVAAVPLAALHALQAWRILGIVFVILYDQGELPAHFALPAGWGDFAIGLTAPLVALALARRERGSAAVATLWNVIGLADLVVAVGMGTGLLAPLFMPDVGARVPPAAAMGVFPMILVPTFAVPASALVHILALGRLRGAARTRATVAPLVAHHGK